MAKKRATLRDVAKEAGVSYQTVSRVINNQENVAEKTRSRVMSAIEKLDFHVNRAAQIMQTQRSHTIEAVMFYEGFNLFLFEMASAAQQAGYHFSISAITEEELTNALNSAASRFVDGLLIAPIYGISQDYETFSRLCNNIPFVIVGGELGVQLPSVLYDQRRGTQLAVQHLIDLGHTQIAEITGNLQSFDGSERHETALNTLAANGLTPGPCVISNFSITGGYAAMNELLESGEPIQRGLHRQ